MFVITFSIIDSSSIACNIIVVLLLYRLCVATALHSKLFSATPKRRREYVVTATKGDNVSLAILKSEKLLECLFFVLQPLMKM